MEGVFTGDLGRLRCYAALYFTGRKEDYFKRSGKRFTIAEMESALEKAVHKRTTSSQYPGGLIAVQPTKIVKVRCIESNGEFDAFVSGICDEDVDLKSICVEELPSHLVPSRFHKISAIPITGNGKVDREKLRTMANTKGIIMSTGNGRNQRSV